MVAACDKLHNARATLAQIRTGAPDVWKRFKAGREGTLWYLRSTAASVRPKVPVSLAEDLDRTIDEIERASR